MGAGGTPTNEVEATIGTAKDHTTIAAWEAATDENCTTGWGVGIYASPCSPVGVVYDTGDFSDNVVITGATTDSTHYRRLTVVAGQQHNGGYPKSPDGAKMTGYLKVTEDYFEVEKLIIASAAQSSFSHVDQNGGQDVLYRQLIVDVSSSQYQAFNLIPGNAKNPVVENCIAICRKEHAAAIAMEGGYQDGVKWRNCTVWQRATSTPAQAFAYGEATNCIGINGSGVVAFGNSEGSGDWNVGSDTSAPGANSDQYDNTAAADLFADTTDGAEDLRLKSAADGLFEGTDLSAYFTDDINDDTRSDWDIGADEISGGAPPLPVAALSDHHRRMLSA